MGRKQFGILWYVDEDKKTYNPGVIFSDPKVDDEICRVTLKLRDMDRNVKTFVYPIVEDIKKLPPLGEPVGNGIEGYAYDPWLIW